MDAVAAAAGPAAAGGRGTHAPRGEDLRVLWEPAEVNPGNQKAARFTVAPADGLPCAPLEMPYVLTAPGGKVLSRGTAVLCVPVPADLTGGGFGAYTAEAVAPDGTTVRGEVQKRLRAPGAEFAQPQHRLELRGEGWAGQGEWKKRHAELPPPPSPLPRITREALAAKQPKAGSGGGDWIAVRGRVYSVGPFADAHPGGRRALLYTSRDGDATEAYERVHRGIDPESIIGRLCIGLLASDDA
eukprot:TRINITY_DN19689_c0_g1_i1.p1 TRINITY_DN19689_c0_g1~~TRINITY_DN19689_c0_g1_i1.p1  ORF type:complete len:263 (+),score=52.44 TRINITY_DN19689_c0_g1_i1:65-790(+)